ncbi:MAG TPA: amphi-Trp domain-containing protein [Pseudonocardia sp.]
MADIEFTRTETLTREETAKLLVSLADALTADNGHAKLVLGDTHVELHVPERVQTEVEVEVDGNEVELEIELSWSLREPRHTKQAAARAAK